MEFLPPGDFQSFSNTSCCTQRGLEFKEANFRNFRGSVHTIALDVGRGTLRKDGNQ